MKHPAIGRGKCPTESSMMKYKASGICPLNLSILIGRDEKQSSAFFKGMPLNGLVSKTTTPPRDNGQLRSFSWSVVLMVLGLSYKFRPCL